MSCELRIKINEKEHITPVPRHVDRVQNSHWLICSEPVMRTNSKFLNEKERNAHIEVGQSPWCELILKWKKKTLHLFKWSEPVMWSDFWMNKTHRTDWSGRSLSCELIFEWKRTQRTYWSDQNLSCELIFEWIKRIAPIEVIRTCHVKWFLNE
jgi:hypothetical protein